MLTGGSGAFDDGLVTRQGLGSTTGATMNIEELGEINRSEEEDERETRPFR